jgi:starvation-inducible DNA-binding protein
MLADTVAERAVALGHVPDGQAAAVSAAGVASVERAPLSDQEVVRAVAHRVAGVSEAIRTRMDRLGDIDLASQDVLVAVVGELEQQQWMLRAQLDA